MHSNRFQCAIRLTCHAQTRMLERNISEDLLLDLIETRVVPLNFRDEPRAKWGITFPEGVALASKEVIPGTTRVHG